MHCVQLGVHFFGMRSSKAKGELWNMFWYICHSVERKKKNLSEHARLSQAASVSAVMASWQAPVVVVWHYLTSSWTTKHIEEASRRTFLKSDETSGYLLHGLTGRERANLLTRDDKIMGRHTPTETTNLRTPTRWWWLWGELEKKNPTRRVATISTTDAEEKISMNSHGARFDWKFKCDLAGWNSENAANVTLVNQNTGRVTTPS